jgi:hypothetical protein
MCRPELLELGRGLPEQQARDDQLLDLLGALEDTRSISIPASASSSRVRSRHARDTPIAIP